MGHKHTKDEILAGALDVALDDGLSRLTFGRVAKRLGISDRVVVYYFPTKNDLLGEVVVSLSARLQATLAAAFSAPAADHRQLMATAWPLVATAEVDPVSAVFFEANGLAAAGRPPYAELLPELVTGWIDAVADIIEAEPEARRGEAEAAIALLDGLLLVRQLVGPDAADRAAHALGIT